MGYYWTSKIYDIARGSETEKAPDRTHKSKVAIVVAEIWQTGENLKSALGPSGGIFLARLALSKISRETVST
jgi:hypothetical protein